MVFHPLRLVRVNFLSGSAIPLHFLKGFRQWLRFFRNSEDELVIADIDSTTQQFSALGIGSSDKKIFASHHIPLESCSNKSVNMFSNRNKNLSRKMTAFLPAMKLVFKMDSSSSILGK